MFQCDPGYNAPWCNVPNFDGMRTIILNAILLFSALLTSGQGKYLTNDGYIKFYSHTVIEDITAQNRKVAAVFDAIKGEVVVIVVMSEFQFEKKLMQEHFNENFVESHKYPKAIFNGRIENNISVDYNTQGTYTTKVQGEMTIHGTTRSVSAEGTLEVTANGIIARTGFFLNPGDYEIKIPRVVRDNIAENMEITVELRCNPI